MLQSRFLRSIRLLSVAGVLLLFYTAALAAPSLLSLSHSIDSLDLEIRRADSDTLRTALSLQQGELVAQANSLQQLLLAAQAAELSTAPKGGSAAPLATAPQSVDPSLKSELLSNLIKVTITVLLLCSGSFLLLRKLFRTKKSKRNGEPPLSLVRQGAPSADESSYEPLRTEEIRIAPPIVQRKLKRKQRARVLSPTSLLQNDELEHAENAESLEPQATPSVLNDSSFTSTAADLPQSSIESEAEREGLREDPPPLFLSPSALTRLEQEDRTRADVLKLTRRGYTSSEIARRMRLPQQQVEEMVSHAQLRGE